MQLENIGCFSGAFNVRSQPQTHRCFALHTTLCSSMDGFDQFLDSSGPDKCHLLVGSKAASGPLHEFATCAVFATHQKNYSHIVATALALRTDFEVVVWSWKMVLLVQNATHRTNTCVHVASCLSQNAASATGASQSSRPGAAERHQQLD